MSWREQILSGFNPQINPFLIVEDSDGLLQEPDLLGTLETRGYEIIAYEDPIAFRFFYESRVRNHSHHPLIVSVDGRDYQARALPYDLLQAATVITLSLTRLFADIQFEVLTRLQPQELDALDRALSIYNPGRMGENLSLDFVLRHVYQIAPELIQSPADLLRTLLRIHYRTIRLPKSSNQRFIYLLKRQGQFFNWPLDDIVTDAKAFFAFLQEHWPKYIKAVLKALRQGIKEPKAVYDINEVILPYGHDDVRVYIDNLFLEGFLQPIDVEEAKKLQNHWSMVGVRQDPLKQRRQRVTGLIDISRQELPEENARHSSWLRFAQRWAELTALVHRYNEDVDLNFYKDLRTDVDQRFEHWMLDKYGALHNQPPAMLHHIPRQLARQREEDPSRKVALLLIDGLALDQWVTLRDVMSNTLNNATMTESAVFAWVPTLTSVSRQALFSGRAPLYFAKTIATTNNEEKAWQQFWADHGLTEQEVFYARGLGKTPIGKLTDRISDHRFKAIGLIINTVDDIMHGMQLGSSGMHNQIQQWTRQGFLHDLIAALLDSDFAITLTSDHGNIAATGSGRISEGAVAESRGERVRIYATDLLRQQAAEKAEQTILWPQYGLPDDYQVLLAGGRNAFITKGETIVGHGGISLEEVIVPYVQMVRDIP